MQDTNTLIEILTDLVKGFTRHHADLVVTDSQPTKHSLVISFKPHADDIGKIIGEGGCNVKALQIIAAAMGLALAGNHGCLQTGGKSESPGRWRVRRRMAGCSRSA
jgi:predicted RNA-binding protein YlqC (UPF0109 family)